MNINTIFNNYLANGYSNLNAISKTCQDIILAQISNSSLNKNVTIKGGVVMMAISKDIRRATQDLDIDFIRYSLDDSAIETFIEKFNKPAFTIEIGKGKNPLPINDFPSIYKKLEKMLVFSIIS